MIWLYLSLNGWAWCRSGPVVGNGGYLLLSFKILKTSMDFLCQNYAWNKHITEDIQMFEVRWLSQPNKIAYEVEGLGCNDVSIWWRRGRNWIFTGDKIGFRRCMSFTLYMFMLASAWFMQNLTDGLSYVTNALSLLVWEIWPLCHVLSLSFFLVELFLLANIFSHLLSMDCNT